MNAPLGLYLLTVPLLLAFVADLAWVAWSQPALPPLFRGYAVRGAWEVDPLAILDQGLRRDQWSVGILAVRDRLMNELHDRYDLPFPEMRRRFLPPSFRHPAIARACSEVRALESTYSLALRAEDPLRTDLWSQWRRPVWRAQVRREFERELHAVETLLAEPGERP